MVKINLNLGEIAFGSCQKTGTHLNAFSTQGQCRCQGLTMAESTGPDNRDTGISLHDCIILRFK